MVASIFPSISGLGLAQEQEHSPKLDEEGIESALEQDGLGLALEELLTNKGKIKLGFGITYSASNSVRPIGAFQTIQTGPDSQIAVPVALGQSRQEADRLIVSTNIRYGLTRNIEIFLQSSAHYSNNRTTENFTHSTDTSEGGHFLNAVLGVNYRFWEDGKYPGFIGFVDVSVAENVAPTGAEFVFGKSATLGFTSYKVIDPVVLSLTMRYRAAFPRAASGARLDPGDSVFLGPSIAFAVNNELTLTGNLSLRFELADKIDGVARGTNRSRANMGFGIAYAWDQKTTLRMNARTDVTGEAGLTLSMNLTRKFGRKNPLLKKGNES